MSLYRSVSAQGFRFAAIYQDCKQTDRLGLYLAATEPRSTSSEDALSCREAKKPEAILNGDSFSFMKNSCGDDKFVVIELSQRVKLTSLEVSMIELYSSRARTIDLYSTLTKPVKASESPWLVGDWAYHATVKAENKKGEHVRSESPTRSLFVVSTLTACQHCAALSVECSNSWLAEMNWVQGYRLPANPLTALKEL